MKTILKYVLFIFMLFFCNGIKAQEAHPKFPKDSIQQKIAHPKQHPDSTKRDTASKNYAVKNHLSDVMEKNARFSATINKNAADVVYLILDEQTPAQFREFLDRVEINIFERD